MTTVKGNPKLSGTRSNGNGVWAALHRQEGKWRLLMARRKERWEVLESRTLVDSELSSLPALFEQHGVAHVVRVAPGRETVARCLPVPAGDDAGLLAAVSLLAEAELPSTLPTYRRAAGVLPGDGSEARTALLTGWMLGDNAPLPVSEMAENWTTPAAALALLRGDSGRAAVYTEASEGLMCLLVPGPERTIARVLVEQPSDEESWARTISGAVSEAAQMAGASASFAQNLNANRRTGAGRRVFLEPGSLVALKSRVSGLREDQGWLDDFGIALGALLVAGSEQAATASLALLHARPPAEERGPVEMLTQWLGRPANAWGVIAAACVLMLLGPLGVAYARKAILESQANKVRGMNVGSEGVEKKAAMYDQFNISRWPMTKLLADVAQSTPVGVVVTNLQLTNGQGLSMQGTAESPDQITKLEANLIAAKVFGSVSLNRVDAKSDTLTEFDLSAKIVQPNTQVKVTDDTDFAKTPVAVRLYGEGASNAAPPEVAHEDRPSRSERSGRRHERSPESSAERTSAGDERRPSAGSANEPVPAALSDADIAKLDRAGAMKEWSNRKRYVAVHQSTLEAAAKQRLEAEIPKLFEQMKKAASESASAPAPAPASGGKQ